MIGTVLGLALLLGFLLRDTGVGWQAVLVLAAGTLAGCVLTSSWRDRALIGFAVLLVGVGAWRAAGSVPRSSMPASVALASTFQGVVVGLPRHYPERTSVKLELHEPDSTAVWARLPPYPTVQHGDVLVVTGWAREWGADRFSDPITSDRLRDTSGYLYATYVAVRDSEGTIATHMRQEILNWVAWRVRRFVPEPAATLTTGVLTGDDAAMTTATRDAFRAAGLSHITAVSGWNLALVAGSVMIIARWSGISPRVASLVALALIWLFAGLVGMPGSAVRAGVMLSLYLAAYWRGRPSHGFTALCLGTAAIVFVQPDARFDLGFQLSVAATLGLILSAELLEGRPRWVAAVLLPTSAQLAVTPLILHVFGTYSLVAPITNMLAAPLIPVIMVGGLLVLGASIVHPVLADVAGVLAWAPARAVVWIAEAIAEVPWVSGQTVAMDRAWLLLAYSLMLALYWAIRLFTDIQVGNRGDTHGPRVEENI